MTTLLFLLLFQTPTKPYIPLSGPVETFGGEEHVFIMPHSGKKHIQFKQDYHSPVYWVWDLTDDKAAVRLIDKTYAHAADIVVEAPAGHKIRLKVGGR
jgi:hypothetical protein